jgi:hypothetical protein
MKNIWTVSLILFLFITVINAQQRTAHISFRRMVYDFKTIKEIKGPASTVFSFINTGSVPVTLQNVTASCGCTTPEYTKSPVMPGDSGFVKATYDPTGRPGNFSKEITVLSNADNSPITLKITGNVEPREPKMEEEYRYPMGNLRLETGYLGFGRMNFGTSNTINLKMINSGNNDITVDFANLPQWIKAKANKVVLKPKEKKEIGITYNTVKKNDWGFLMDYVILIIDGKQDPKNKITVTAEVMEDFSKLTPEQKANAPKIKFESSNYNYNSVAESTLVTYDYKFTNMGKSDLKIRKVNITCDCLKVTPKIQTIKPGETSSINVVFNTKGYKGPQTKTVTVITNDPASPQITLWLKGIVR